MRERTSNLRGLLAAMVRQAGALRLQQTASALTLLTLLAIVPMAALGLLGLSALPAFQPMRERVEAFLVEQLFLPSFRDTIGRQLNAFVAAAEQLSALGTVLFFATAVMAMLTIDRTLNHIWGSSRPRPLAQRLALYWAMLTVGPVLLGLALGLQVQVASRLADASLAIAVSAALLPTMLTVVGLALLYRFAPNAPVRWTDALVGALFASLLLLGLKRLLGASLGVFDGYAVVYGAFAALPLFLSWLFAVWSSVLLGALLAANLRAWGFAGGSVPAHGPQAEFERTVSVLAELLRAAPGPLPGERLRGVFGDDPRLAERVATQLVADGYLVRMWPARGDGTAPDVWGELWLAAPGLAERTLRPVFDRAWRGTGADAAGTVDPGGDVLQRPLGEVLAPGAPGRR